MNNSITYTGYQFARAGVSFPSAGVKAPSNHLFRNANPATYNNSSPLGPLNSPDAIAQLSPGAQMMMLMMRMTAQLSGGVFDQMMEGFGGALHGVPVGIPDFGSERKTTPGSRSVGGPGVIEGTNASPTGRGEAKEMKAGQTVRGANGSLVRWGQNGTVDINYQDKNGQTKTVQVKDGKVSFDGGKPQKLENVGQILKLPNGDTVGIGNNPKADGQKDLVRVVVADSVDKIRTEPAGATNIYDLANMEHKSTRNEGAGFSLKVTGGSYRTPFGGGSYLNANFSAFAGIPVTRSYTRQMMRQLGSK